MELLRRALIVGCLLPGVWLMRLAPLDSLLTLAPIDFAARRAREAAAVPDDRKTREQQRNAEVALPVYIEETVQYNIFPASGPEWDQLLRGVDQAALDGGAAPALGWRTSPYGQEDASGSHTTFFQPSEPPVDQALDQLAVGRGTTYVSISRPGFDRHYRLDRRTWTRQDFRFGSGFVGTPAPPRSFLYPFRWVGAGIALLGIVLFTLLPADARSTRRLGVSVFDGCALAAGVLLFSLPLFLVGGSVQALTRAPIAVLICWSAAAAAVHVFASPARNVPGPARTSRVLFLREGFAFLVVAIGPLTLLMLASMMLWNR